MTSTTLNSARSFQEFPCSKCGGKLEFNPKAGGVKCIYCSNEADISQDTTSQCQYRSQYQKNYRMEILTLLQSLAKDEFQISESFNK